MKELGDQVLPPPVERLLAKKAGGKLVGYIEGGSLASCRRDGTVTSVRPQGNRSGNCQQHCIKLECAEMGFSIYGRENTSPFVYTTK